MRQELAKINAAVSENCANLAPYQFLTAFSQLISRVCHSSSEVFGVLNTIVAKVLLAYPQQAMWLMTAVSKVGGVCGDLGWMGLLKYACHVFHSKLL